MLHALFCMRLMPQHRVKKTTLAAGREAKVGWEAGGEAGAIARGRGWRGQGRKAFGPGRVLEAAPVALAAGGRGRGEQFWPDLTALGEGEMGMARKEQVREGTEPVLEQ